MVDSQIILWSIHCIDWNQIHKTKKTQFFKITFDFCIHFKRENFFFSFCFLVAPVKVYKKVVKFSFKQQKIFWVLVFSFMYLVLVDATDRSYHSKILQNCFSFFWAFSCEIKYKRFERIFFSQNSNLRLLWLEALPLQRLKWIARHYAKVSWY